LPCSRSMARQGTGFKSHRQRDSCVLAGRISGHSGELQVVGPARPIEGLATQGRSMTAIEQRNSRRFRRYILLAGVIAVVLVGAGLVWYDYRFPSWQEEVLLPDGRMIVVKQRRDFIEGYGTRRTWLTFSLPEMGGERTWSEAMQPILIAVASSGEVYVIGWPSGFNQMSSYRLPRYGYVAFRWGGVAFQRVPLLSVPVELRQEENIVRCLPRRAFVSWSSKLTSGCDDEGNFRPGISRRIDLIKMQERALKDAQLRNVLPQSE